MTVFGLTFGMGELVRSISSTSLVLGTTSTSMMLSSPSVSMAAERDVFTVHRRVTCVQLNFSKFAFDKTHKSQQQRPFVVVSFGRGLPSAKPKPVSVSIGFIPVYSYLTRRARLNLIRSYDNVLYTHIIIQVVGQ